MNNALKKVKKWLSFILTALLVVFLFGVIFIRLGFASLSSSFFLELGAVLLITIQTRFWWWSNTEEKVLSSDEIKTTKKEYYKNVDTIITDSNDFGEYVKILNIENKDNYIQNRIGSITVDNIRLNIIDKILKRNKLEKYNRFYFKILRNADKLREIRASEITSYWI